MKNLLLACALISLSAVAAGCGGDSGGSNTVGGPACGVAPCGGDIVGTWNASDICMSRSILMAAFVEGLMGSCPSASLGNVDPGPSGTFVFNSDLTYSINLTMSLSVGVNFPGACLPTGATCADLSAAIQQEVAGDPTVQSAACTGASTCVCTLVQTPVQATESGTYTVSGSSLFTTSTTQTAPDELFYCVKDGTVTLKDATPDPTNPITAFVATK